MTGKIAADRPNMKPWLAEDRNGPVAFNSPVAVGRFTPFQALDLDSADPSYRPLPGFAFF